MSNLNDISGIGPSIATGLANIGITTTEQLSSAKAGSLIQVRGISERRAQNFIAMAKTLLAIPEHKDDIAEKASKAEVKAAETSKPAKEKSKSKKASKAKAKKDKAKSKIKATEGKQSKKGKVKKAGKSASDKKTKKAKKKT
ncbi:helix-hairpin-helix domain-containing protein [Roseovarius sp.]|uniref:helix-hairpin-helix domain-containing protein n=1 Tax=Roseovarius sp. TaxID=1486281 RepID=UPI003A971EC4